MFVFFHNSVKMIARYILIENKSFFYYKIAEMFSSGGEIFFIVPKQIKRTVGYIVFNMDNFGVVWANERTRGYCNTAPGRY